jgi:hypothetical protein
MLPLLKRIDRMKTIDNLKAVILITSFGSATIVSELSGNIHFIEDIKHYGGFVEDIFYDVEIPKEKGFYEFNGKVDVGTDINGNVDETNYHGTFTKLEDNDFIAKLGLVT